MEYFPLTGRQVCRRAHYVIFQHYNELFPKSKPYVFFIRGKTLFATEKILQKSGFLEKISVKTLAKNKFSGYS